jgi:hypothetical protein
MIQILSTQDKYWPCEGNINLMRWNVCQCGKMAFDLLAARQILAAAVKYWLLQLNKNNIES